MFFCFVLVFVHMVQTEASSSYSCSYKYFSYVSVFLSTKQRWLTINNFVYCNIFYLIKFTLIFNPLFEMFGNGVCSFVSKNPLQK